MRKLFRGWLKNKRILELVMVRAMIKETEMLSSATASISIWDEKELVRLYGREAILSYLTEETHND